MKFQELKINFSKNLGIKINPKDKNKNKILQFEPFLFKKTLK